MMPPVKTPAVRPRRDEDLTALLTVLRRVHDADGYPVRWHEPAAAWLTPDNTELAWTAVLGDVPAGHVALESNEGGALHVARLFLDPGARGQGLAELLLAAVTGAAGARPLSLEVHVRATAAIACYERLGWRRTGTHEARWTEADGTPALAHVYVAPERAD